MPLSPADFVHLHVHSEFSLLDGANRIGALVKHVKAMGQQAVAITDHGVMFGALDFYNTCKKEGIKPIVGCEAYITPGSRTERPPGSQRETAHLLLLAMDHEGYKNLGRISTIGHTEGFYYKPRIDFETLAKHSAGIVATTSCMSGLIPRAILDGNERALDAHLQRFLDIFGRDRFFVELQDHGITEQRTLNKGLVELARRADLKLIASNDAHYTRREDATIHDLLLCIQTGCVLADTNRMKFDTAEFYVKSTAEMESIFGEMPECLTNTLLVAELCNLVMPKREYHLPKFPCPDGKSEKEYLPEQVWEGVRKRYGERADTDQELRGRVTFELEVISNMGFDAYFLIVADFIAWARSQRIPVGPGRGSAAGSVVAYALGITELCPLEHGLLFERFLNPDRISMPDIDVDFCFERRGEVIEYVRRKYGEQCVSHIITFGTIKAKLAVRDVGRVMGMALPVVDSVAKLIPEGAGVTLKESIAESPELKELSARDPQVKQLLEAAAQIEGRVRHAGTHAAGIVIADRDLTEYCPLYKSPREETVATQFTMNQVEEIGLLKMDFLGIKNLTMIERVERWLKERDGIEIDWTRIPMDDPGAYRLLGKGQTAGVFQLESEGMTALVRAMQPSNFADLTALIALYRPGPLQAGMHTMYVNRKHGREPVTYDHPILEPILGESYGTILYQEQVMRISQEMCGFSRGDADVLRKAMGKKIKEVMDKQEAKFVSGALAKSGVPEDLARHIWQQIVTFAGYGFNKSHSAAYAVITFRTAYLRAHHPVYFLAAMLTNEIGADSDTIAKYVSICREAGIEVMPPDVNGSREYFNPDGQRVWYALAAVKTVGEAVAARIVEERTKNGDYKSLPDFFARMVGHGMNARVAEALAKVGAFDRLEPRRASLVAAIPDLMEYAQATHRDRAGGQESLFASLDEAASPDEFTLRPVAEWDPKVRANFEKELLGFHLSNHPLAKYRLEFESLVTHRSSQLKEVSATLSGNDRIEDVRVLGIVTNVRILTDKQNRSWAIVSMEDLDGPFEVKFFARSFETCRSMIENERAIMVTGRLSVWNSRASLEGLSVRDASTLREDAKGLLLCWKAHEMSRASLTELKELCRRFGGKRPVRVSIETPDGLHHAEVSPGAGVRVSISEDMVGELRKLPGRPRVRLVL